MRDIRLKVDGISSEGAGSDDLAEYRLVNKHRLLDLTWRV